MDNLPRHRVSEKGNSFLKRKAVRSPHFAKFWEAAIKAFKRHFMHVVGEAILTYKAFHIYTTEIEAKLPLSHSNFHRSRNLIDPIIYPDLLLRIS
ncbi:hypothetical protein HZH68_009191 [Vespula germanica]|uniref:Uncharacterized protein n=1 Tax=Vespula germanica TaxID=30212 RepID=A0A834N7Q5_VESGE|nr:hypothetical protein HZH68_009191 [Vespula germanica]